MAGRAKDIEDGKKAARSTGVTATIPEQKPKPDPELEEEPSPKLTPKPWRVDVDVEQDSDEDFSLNFETEDDAEAAVADVIGAGFLARDVSAKTTKYTAVIYPIYKIRSFRIWKDPSVQ